MSTATLEPPTTEFAQATRIDSMITYPVSKSDIATLKAKFQGLLADTPKGYEQVRLAIGQCRDLRGKIETRREELKADSLEFGRKVDTVARFLRTEIEAIEGPLKLLKNEVDDRKKKEREAEEAAERAKVEAELKARADAHEAKLRAEREAEEARLAEERKRLAAERAEMEAKQKVIDEANRKAAEEARIKQEKIDAENKRIADEQAAKQKAIDEANRIEWERLDTERKTVEAAKQKAEREEFERQAKARAEQEAKDAIEAARVANEKADADHKAWQESERVRLEALKPDIAKVHEFAKAIRSLQCTGIKSLDAQNAVHQAMAEMAEIAEKLESFQADEIPY